MSSNMDLQEIGRRDGRTYFAAPRLLPSEAAAMVGLYRHAGLPVQLESIGDMWGSPVVLSVPNGDVPKSPFDPAKDPITRSA